MKKALRKLTKSEKRRAASLREEIDWLEKKLQQADHGLFYDVRLKKDDDKLQPIVTPKGRYGELRNRLMEMKREHADIYGPAKR